MLEKSISFAAEACRGILSPVSKKPYILELMESVVIMSSIDSDDTDLMAAEAVLRTLEHPGSAVTPDDIEADFGARIKSMAQAANVAEADDIKKLPLKIKMLVLARELANLRSMAREYSYYNEGLWQTLPEKDPSKLAAYYYGLCDIFHEFEEYPVFGEFRNLTAVLFVKHRA